MIKKINYFLQAFLIYLFFFIGLILGIKISIKIFSSLFSIVGPFFKSKKTINKNLEIDLPKINDKKRRYSPIEMHTANTNQICILQTIRVV